MVHDPSMLLLFGGPLASVAAGIWSFVATLTWRGGWRWVGAVPILAFFAYVAVFLAPDWSRDPTSHNLWPFEVGIWLCPCLPYMAVVTAIHARRGATP